MNNKVHLRPKDYDSNGDIIPTSWKEDKGDLISREALRKAVEEERQYLLATGQTGAEHILVHHCLPHIDNAPTVEAFTEEDMAGAYNEGYACGGRESKRPQGEFTINELKGYLLFYGYSSDAVEDTLINFESYVKGKKGGAE